MKFVDSNSGPESQNITCQKTMILAERLCIIFKTSKDRKKESDSVKIKLERHLGIEFCLKKSIKDNFRAIAIVV